MKFLFKVTVFYLTVKYLTLGFLTYGSAYYPAEVNAVYDFNAQIIQSVPYYGENLRALSRTWVEDGTVVFWEVWLGLGLLLMILRPVWNYGHAKPWHWEERMWNLHDNVYLPLWRWGQQKPWSWQERMWTIWNWPSFGRQRPSPEQWEAATEPLAR
jgi:hypothetical protein